MGDHITNENECNNINNNFVITKSDSNASSLADNLAEFVQQNYFSSISTKIDSSLHLQQQQQQQQHEPIITDMTLSFTNTINDPSTFYCSSSTTTTQFQDNSYLRLTNTNSSSNDMNYYYYPLNCSFQTTTPYSNSYYQSSCLTIDDGLSVNDINKSYIPHTTAASASQYTNLYNSENIVYSNNTNCHSWSSQQHQNELEYYLSNFDFENAIISSQQQSTVEVDDSNEDASNYKLPNVSTLFASTPMGMLNPSQFSAIFSTPQPRVLDTSSVEDTTITTTTTTTTSNTDTTINKKIRKLYTKKNNSEKKKKKNNDEDSSTNILDDDIELKKKRGRPKSIKKCIKNLDDN